jgi:hypothetical protein
VNSVVAGVTEGGRPAEHADVEVKDAVWVPPGEQHREERDHRQHGEGEPEEDEDDVVRDGEEPLDPWRARVVM